MTENKDICMLCERECPKDALSCGRGRRAAGQTETGASCEGHEHEEHDHNEKHGHGGHRGEYGMGGHGDYHGRGGHGPCMRDDGGEDLVSLLERCGRFLLHHGGFSRGQMRILEILDRQKAMSQRDLQELLGVQPGSMSEILAKLEAKGFICRDRDGEDKRMVVISITSEGVARLRATQVRPSEDQVFAALTAEEKEQLRVLLMKLQTGWHKGHGEHHGPHHGA